MAALIFGAALLVCVGDWSGAMSGYDVGQICLNGHVTNDEARRHPQHNQPFCSTCGAATIMACPACDQPIRGEYHAKGVVWLGPSQYKVPAFCIPCGAPFPWTATALREAKDLADELELDDDDREALKRNVDALVTDSPATAVAATRFRKVLQKAGPAATTAHEKVLLPIVVEAAKQVLFPGP